MYWVGWSYIFEFSLEMTSMAATKFCGIFIDGGCVPGPVPRFLLPSPKVYTDLVNGLLG